MKQKLKSLRVRMLIPVVAMTLFIVILLTILFSRAYTGMILQQEQEMNGASFETISRSITPLIETSISKVRAVLSDDRVVSYARLRYNSEADRIHARISCRDYLRGEMTRNAGIFGLLFMRKDGSLFGTLPEGNFFLDRPEENPLPEEMKNQILSAPLGRTLWTGPVSGAELYGFRNSQTPNSIMVASWKTVDVRYGECYAMMLMDESIFAGVFASLQDGKSTWHVFTEDLTEIYHSGGEACADPGRLISESNSGTIFRDGADRPACAFSMKLESPAWTLVRQVAMEDYEQVIRGVRGSVALLAGVVFLIALAVYELWLKKFMRQFRSLLDGITRMGQSDTEPITTPPSSISEFETMQMEINRTSLALNQQMDTIARMTAEKERSRTEMNLARNIQASALPSVFPAFPERTEFDLHAFMTPAREVGGDFYDFFLTDSDHLALVIADVAGKGIPAALFMMNAKALIRDRMMTGCDPAAALERVNAQICEGNTSMMFVTVWLAVLEISTGKGLVCNAGHENPALRRAGGDFEMLEYRHDKVVGVLEGIRFTNREFELRPGDCLFVYTDGVPEAVNAGDKMFGTERITDTLNRQPGAEPEELIRKVREAVERFADETEQFDDITMLCCRYNGPGKREQSRGETGRGTDG